MTLALKYRPSRFSEVAGQKPTAAVLYQMCRRKTVPAGLLFTGERGCGKTSTARILGAALNCAEDPGPAATWPCGVCASCRAVAATISPDVIEVDAASNGGVEQVRELRKLVQYGTGGEYRVVLLDEAHSMSEAAFNALLKVLEEPPGQTTFVLLTTEPGKIIKTVRSRCMQFPFNPISAAVISARLAYICEAEGIEAEPALLTVIAERASGGMRDAIMTLDQVTSVGITTEKMWRELSGESDFAPTLLTFAADGYYQGMFTVLDDAISAAGDPAWVTSQVIWCLRDLLVLSQPGGEVTVQGEALAARQDLAARLGPGRVVQALRVLWDLQTRVRAEDREAMLSLAVVMVSEKLCPQAAITPPEANGRSSLGVSELRTMFGG